MDPGITCRVLAFTNERVHQFNDHIRTMRNWPDELVPGEIVTVNTVCEEIQEGFSTDSLAEIVSVDYTRRTEVFDHDDEGRPLDLDYYEVSIKKPGTGPTLFSNVRVPFDRQRFIDLHKYFSRKKKWSIFFDMEGRYPDFRASDASTVHKSQGSTFDTVIVDLSNISTCNIPDQAARMLYVALSRAKNRVILYGDLADKYGGLIFP